jgi:hypothetical protein
MYASTRRVKLTFESADINPIGSISKTDLKKFIAYARDAFDLPVLERYPSHNMVLCACSNL